MPGEDTLATRNRRRQLAGAPAEDAVTEGHILVGEGQNSHTWDGANAQPKALCTGVIGSGFGELGSGGAPPFASHTANAVQDLLGFFCSGIFA